MSPPPGHKSETKEGYRVIFKASSLLGGSQGICYLFSIIRTKVVAHFLGPSGIGLLGLYSAISNALGVVAGLGIGESAIREIAVAYGADNRPAITRAVTVTRRVSLFCGFLGLVLSLVFAKPLSIYCFGNAEHSTAIAILGLTLLAGAVAAGELALLQGSGSYVKMANVNILSASVGAVPAIVIFAIWREAGIIPSFLVSSAVSLGVTLYFSYSLRIGSAAISLRETIAATKPMLALGFSLMFTGILWCGKDVVIRSIITQTYGLEATGIYQSAWALSGLFVNFILNAMGMDFYPRLTAMIDDHPLMTRTVNQQIDIGVLLALPGVLATVTCAPMVLFLLYSAKFVGASGLLAVLSCGVLFKIVSYPINTIQLAKGDARGFAIIGSIFPILECGICIPLIARFGPMGAAVGYFLSCVAHVFVMIWVGRRMIGYRIDTETVILLLAALLQICLGLLIAFFLHGFIALGFGAALVLTSGVFCMRGLAKRVGNEHRVVRMILSVPFGKLIIPDASSSMNE